MQFPSAHLLLLAFPHLISAQAPQDCSMAFTTINSWTESGHRYRVEGQIIQQLGHNVRQMADDLCNTYKSASPNRYSLPA